MDYVKWLSFSVNRQSKWQFLNWVNINRFVATMTYYVWRRLKLVWCGTLYNVHHSFITGNTKGKKKWCKYFDVYFILKWFQANFVAIQVQWPHSITVTTIWIRFCEFCFSKNHFQFSQNEENGLPKNSINFQNLFIFIYCSKIVYSNRQHWCDIFNRPAQIQHINC